jgi:hypothetical protein
LPVRLAHPQVLPWPFQLVKFQPHRREVQYGPARDWSFRPDGEVCPDPSLNQALVPASGLSRAGPGVCL